MTAAAEPAAIALRALAGAEHPYPEGRFTGRGIVVCAGGGRMLTCAWVGLSVLRRTLGCRLPIELWHLGPEELGVTEEALFAELDVTTVDALSVPGRDPARVLGGWELKPYAVANCRFEEVLLLDADNVAISDPASLFVTDAYHGTGALFWPDVTRIAVDSEIWALCGIEPRNEPAWESGQLVIDKARHWAPLALVRHMNDHSELFYRHLYGDKDTFHLAWRMLEQPHALVERRPRVLPYGLLQHDLDGEPLFQHRNQAKWTLRGDNPTDPGFRHGDECLAALADLERRWSGRVELVPARSPGDVELEGELAAVRLFDLDREGSDRSVIELLPGNRVGEGATDAWLRWYVLDAELMLAGLPGDTARLTHASDGAGWRGRSLQPDGQPLTLAPLPGAESDPAAAVVAALVRRVAAGAVSPEDAVDALATLAAVTEMATLLTRERSRWPAGSVAADTIDRARWRLGRRNPSLRATDGGEARRYVSG